MELYAPLDEELSGRLGPEAHGHLNGVPRKGEIIFLFSTVKDAVDFCGEEVAKGTAHVQVVLYVLGEYPRKVMSGVFGQFLFHVVSPPFRRSGSRVSRFQGHDGQQSKTAKCGRLWPVLSCLQKIIYPSLFL